MFQLSGSLFLVMRWRCQVRCWLLAFVSLLLVQADVIGEEEGAKNKESRTEKDDIFRPRVGEFPPQEKANSYRGELVFVDHANRRGSVRIQTEGKFRFISPSPFAMLPYGIVRYQGAPQTSGISPSAR